MLEGLFPGSLGIMHAALGGLQKREAAISENLANIDTPSYKRLEVGFESLLRRYRARHSADSFDLSTTSPQHFSAGPQVMADIVPVTWRSTGTAVRNDGNNVDVDFEMTLLAQTELTYNSLAELMKRDFEGLKSVLRGG
ncbi:MAG: flagellar basal body rod protein FlgB [Cyanobacteria bacterium NC_groundwater_1444_Ag_S-0.65um_54_12]|nr:flagellar basal body rod protein FlgB [Cyanobacteria bacterium NC_groundwater_1444_Ag_S-0.65um_54_12]